MIIDCHVHLNRYEEEEPATLEARYDLLCREMAEHGVDYALVLSSYKRNENRPSADEILEVIGDDPRLGVVAGVSYTSYRAADLAHLRVLLRTRSTPVTRRSTCTMPACASSTSWRPSSACLS